MLTCVRGRPDQSHASGAADCRPDLAQDDEISAFAEVYDDHVPPHQVDIVTTVRSAAGAVVFEETEERASSARQSTRGGLYRHVARIPLTAFEPGHYI